MFFQKVQRKGIKSHIDLKLNKIFDSLGERCGLKFFRSVASKHEYAFMYLMKTPLKIADTREAI